MLAFLYIAVLLLWIAPAHAELYRCPQADGTELFTDREEQGCRAMIPRAELGQVEAPAPHLSSPPRQIHTAPPRPSPPSIDPSPGSLSSAPFISASRQVPALLLADLAEHLKAKGFSIPNKGDVAMIQLDVSHVPDGTGPIISTDYHFRAVSDVALERAVHAAAKGARYDPRYLRVYMWLPVALWFDRGFRIDGPSAGMGWALAVASAILGDPVRSTVCFSGTIDLALEIGPVGGLLDKVDGCRRFGYTTMLVPASQTSNDLRWKNEGLGIQTRGVETLAEAYEVATGRSLRPFQ